MRLPYNTGRVQIGIAYEPHQRYDTSADEERLQSALLRKPRNSRPRAAEIVLFGLFIGFAVIPFAI